MPPAAHPAQAGEGTGDSSYCSSDTPTLRVEWSLAAAAGPSELNGMVKDFSDRHHEAKLFASKTTKIENVY
ncbi:hypothetical protein EMIT0158MI4_50224 [Burkholderia ambifaria]|jgi:hypothetical protein